MLGGHFIPQHPGGKAQFPSKWPVVDFHGENLPGQWLAGIGLRSLPHTPDDQPPRLDLNVDAFLVYTGEVETYLDAALTSVGVEGRLPGSTRSMRKWRPGDPRSAHPAKLNISCHRNDGNTRASTVFASRRVSSPVLAIRCGKRGRMSCLPRALRAMVSASPTPATFPLPGRHPCRHGRKGSRSRFDRDAWWAQP